MTNQFGEGKIALIERYFNAVNFMEDSHDSSYKKKLSLSTDAQDARWVTYYNSNGCKIN